MSNRFAEYAPIHATNESFSAKLRESLNRKIAGGKSGINRDACYEKSQNRGMAFRNHEMSDYVFDLACQIHAQKIPLIYREWVYWMTDAGITERPDSITVYHRSSFYCHYAKLKVGEAIEKFFGKPVRFVVDNNIEMRVVVN